MLITALYEAWISRLTSDLTVRISAARGSHLLQAHDGGVLLVARPEQARALQRRARHAARERLQRGRARRLVVPARPAQLRARRVLTSRRGAESSDKGMYACSLVAGAYRLHVPLRRN